MRKKRSRLISIFLTVAMVLSFVPSTGLTAYAEGETEVSTWENLRAELKKDGDISVKLTDDIKVELAKTGDEYVNSAYRADITGGNKRLDLNGHTLYVYSNADVDKGLSENAVIALKGNGSLEVLGGGRIFYDNRAGKRGGDGAANAIKLSGNSKLTVTNATIENFYGSAVSMEEGSPQVTLGAGAYLFSANGYGLRSLYSCTGGSVTLDDGVELGNKDTSQTRFYVKGLDGSGNGAMRLANENTSLTINNAVFNGVVEVAGENQKTAFRASGNRFIVDGEEQTDDSLWCDTKSTDLNGWNVAGRFLLHNKEHITKPTKKAVVISSTVSVLSADVDAPAHNGETSGFGAYSSNTDLYTVDSVKWYAGETADGTPMGESEKFRGGDKYTVAVSFKLVSGYNFDSTVTAFLNGKKAVVRDGGDGTKIAVLTFTATELEQKILTAPLTITAPVAGGAIAKDLASSDSRIKVTDCEWYIDEGAEATRKVDGTFSDSVFYTLYFRIEAKKSYSFDNGAIVTVNGKPAAVKNITSKGEVIIGTCYFVIGNDSYDFTEIRSGNVIITEPSGGKELSNVTVAYGSRFDVSDYYWYLGEGSEGKMALEPNTQYIGGALYTLVVRFTPKDGYKFANNMNIFVNGKHVYGGVTSAEGDGYIGYYVFSVGRDVTQVENISLTVKNPVAGEIVNGNDDYQIKAPFDSRYKVNLPTSWYEGEYATQAELTGKSEFWGTFEAGKKYTCYTRVVPKDGYEFPNGGGLTLNNQMVTNKDYFPGVYFILYTFTVPTGGSEKTAITDTLVLVSDLTKTFENNKTKEPTFGGSLTKGTDYTVSYAVKAGSTGELKDDKPYGTGTYVVTVTGIGSYKDSFTKEFVIEKAVQEAPSGLAGVAPTTAGGSDGKITGTTADMEYSKDAAFASKFDCADTETTGLEAGTYYVRYKEKTNYYAGTAATVTVGEGTPVATYTLTVNEGTGSGDYAENVIVTIQANAAATGKQFKEWTGLDSVEFVDGTSKTSATAKFKMPAETVTATATYEDVVIPVEKIAAIPTAKTDLVYDGNEKTGVEAGEGYTLSGTVKATDAGDYTATAALETDYKWNDGTTADKIISWSIDRAVQGTPSGLVGVAPTTAGGSDGKITGTTADMEYSTDAAFASKFDCTDTETTDLEAGTYYVRYKEKTNYYAGTAATVTVGEGTPVATYTLTVNEGTGSGDYAENVIVTIQANAAATGKQFKEWTGLDSVEFVDGTSKTSATAKFKMPAEAVTATATYEDVVIPPSHTHTYDGTWKFDENKHWKECADTSCDNLTGSVKEEATHSFAEVVTPATPTTDGKKESKCSVCGYVGKTETINATGYKITFDAKGGTLTATELHTDRTGKLASLPTATRSGYTFDGWFTAETGGEKVTTEKTFNANITLYAHWTAKSGGSSGGGGGGGGGSATKYAVTVSSADNGKVTSDKTSVARGNLVTITAKANDGYVLDTIKVTDKDGKEIKLTDKSNGKYTFAMPASKVEVKAVFKQTESKPDKPAEEIKTVVVMQVGSKNMFVNGKSYEKDAAPVIMNDRTLVPIRFVTESLGGEVKWNAETKEVTLVIDGKEIKMTIGKNLEKYGVAPVIISDRTFVPIRFVADELGAETEWDDTTKTVTITKTVTEK